MKYFLHDTNSINDDKVSKIYMRFGYEGVGLFYVLLEKIGQQEKPIDTEVLKSQLNVGKKLEKCWQFMEEIDIISSSNGQTFNERILSYSETYQIKKEKNKEKVAQWRKNQEELKTVTSYVPISNPPKVKLSKVKIIIEETPGLAFDDFWKLYPKKTSNKNPARKLWKELSEESKRKAINHLPFYPKETEYKYMLKPENYIAGEAWKQSKASILSMPDKNSNKPEESGFFNYWEYQDALKAWEAKQKTTA